MLALPSLTEGVGLPALEAAACGCPVVATTESPLAGLLGDGGRYVDPRNADELEEALADIVRSPQLRACMRRAGIAASRELSWESSARRLMDLIDSAPAP